MSVNAMMLKTPSAIQRRRSNGPSRAGTIPVRAAAEVNNNQRKTGTSSRRRSVSVIGQGNLDTRRDTRTL